MNYVHKMTIVAKGKRRNAQGGFTLVELMIVLGIAALLAAVAVMFVPDALASIRAGKVTKALSAGIPSIQTAYQNNTSFNNLTTAQVAQNGWFGKSLTEYAAGVPTGNLVTPWGAITCTSASAGMQGQCSLTNIPTRECRKIGEEFTNDLYIAATVNGTAVKTATTGVDLTAVGTQCSSTATNTITFNFGRA